MLNRKTYLNVVGVIFAIIAILHLLRIFNGWQAQIGSFVAPMWLSWVALVVAAYLSYVSFKLRK